MIKAKREKNRKRRDIMYVGAVIRKIVVKSGVIARKFT